MRDKEMPYSLDLRERAVKAAYSGMKKTEICRIFNVCRQTLYSWLLLKETTGNLHPETGFQKGHSHGIKDLEKFQEFVDLHPDYTQKEMAKCFGVGSSTIGRTLLKIGYSRKKRAKLIQKEGKKKGVPI